MVRFFNNRRRAKSRRKICCLSVMRRFLPIFRRISLLVACPQPQPPTNTRKMSLDTDVELEVRRLGGVSGVINLLRERSADESDNAYAGRIELGAALLGCKIGTHTKRGASDFVASTTSGRDHDQHIADSSRIEPSMLSWESKGFVAVLDVLVQGTEESVRTRCGTRVNTCLIVLALQHSSQTAPCKPVPWFQHPRPGCNLRIITCSRGYRKTCERFYSLQCPSISPLLTHQVALHLRHGMSCSGRSLPSEAMPQRQTQCHSCSTCCSTAS